MNINRFESAAVKLASAVEDARLYKRTFETTGDENMKKAAKASFDALEKKFADVLDAVDAYDKQNLQAQRKRAAKSVNRRNPGAQRQTNVTSSEKKGAKA